AAVIPPAITIRTEQCLLTGTIKAGSSSSVGCISPCAAFQSLQAILPGRALLPSRSSAEDVLLQTYPGKYCNRVLQHPFRQDRGGYWSPGWGPKQSPF